MKLKIAFTVEVGPAKRRLIAKHNGDAGIATTAQVREFYRAHGVEGNLLLSDLAEARGQIEGDTQ